MTDIPWVSESFKILKSWAETSSRDLGSIDRPQVVAHATMSAFCQHWPSAATEEMLFLLEQTSEIKALENSRWRVQRRIALAKLSRVISF